MPVAPLMERMNRAVDRYPLVRRGMMVAGYLLVIGALAYAVITTYAGG